MKKILIAIPTARYIEAETFKSIYDLNKVMFTSCSTHYSLGKCAN